MTALRRTLRALAFGAVFLAVCFTAGAADKKTKGLIDGSAFRELADEDAEVVEVNVGGALLQALAGASSEGEVGGVLRGLQSIHAYIVNLNGQSSRIERAIELAAGMEKKLAGQGWESIVTVRDKKSRVNVWTLADGDRVAGLVVTAVDAAEGSAVFVNIAGTIDLAKLGALSSFVDVPGLDAIGKPDGAKPPAAKDKRPASKPE